MMETTEHKVSLYVDRESQQWVVRDSAGNFWALPTTNDAWEKRLPFEPLPDNTLEPIPGHYKYSLGLPF
jgi:hypothetical protein